MKIAVVPSSINNLDKYTKVGAKAFIFGLKDSVDTIGTTESPEKGMLRSLIIAVAHMVYLRFGFDKISEE